MTDLETEDLELLSERGFLIGAGLYVASIFFVGFGGFAAGAHGPRGISTFGILLLLASHVALLISFACSVVCWHRKGSPEIWLWLSAGFIGLALYSWL